MSYVLLGEPSPQSKPKYVGLDRASPTFLEHLPETAPVNKSFLKYIDAGEQFENAEDAIKLARLYQELNYRFDVTRVETAQLSPLETPDGMLGFDVVIGDRWSLLNGGLQWQIAKQPGGTLSALITAYFSPLLNQSGLFDQWNHANFFTEVVRSYSVVFPGSFESDDGIKIMRIVQLTTVFSPS